MGFGETRTANQRSREISNVARQLMSEFSLDRNYQEKKNKEKDCIMKEISVHIGDSD